MADTTTLLSVKYGTGLPVASTTIDGALYFDTANGYVGVKLPDIDFYKLNAELADNATSAITSIITTTTELGSFQTSNYSGSITDNITLAGIGLHATSATTDATAVKTATVDYGVLPIATNNDPVVGTLIAIKFTQAASSGVVPTNLILNYGSIATNAKPIKGSYSNAAVAKGVLCANRTVIFYYDGTNWVSLNEVNMNSNTTYSLISAAELSTAPTATGRLINRFRYITALQNDLSADGAGNLTIAGNAPATSATNNETLAAKSINVYTHPSYTTRTSNLYKITVDATGHVSGATAVTTNDIANYGFKTWTDTVATGVANPEALSFSTAGDGDSGTTGSYTGAAGRKISYNSVGAAPASGISLSAIDWTSGAENWTIPSTLMPKEALLNLKIDSTTGRTTPQGQVYNDVQVGDLIQLTSNSKLFYVAAMDSSNKVTTATEITVGTGVATSTAGSLGLYFNSSSSTVSFSGANASFRLNAGLISSKNNNATATASTASNNLAWINLLMGAYNAASTDTKPFVQGVKLVGSNDIKVYTSNANVITIEHPKPLTAAQSNIGSAGGTLTTTNKLISFTVPRLSVSTAGHVTAISGETLNIGVEAYFTEGDKFATIGGVDIYGGVTWDTF